jgi:pilus assembly protein CpaE
VSEITVGILSPSIETSESLRIQLNATGLAIVKLEVEEYCVAKGDRATRRFTESQPEIIVVDMHDRSPALQSLHILHSVLPDTWLFVTSSNDDPQLIIETMRAGAREFLPAPVTSRGLQQALGRYLAERQKQKESRRIGKMYCVTAAKCGGGATTVAINTAVALAAAPDVKVALFDLNRPVGDIAALLNLKPRFIVEDALAAAARLDSALLDSYTNSVHDVSVLAGVKTFQPGPMAPTPDLARLLEVAAETYTHCFLDFPMSSNKEAVRLAADISSGILLVVTPELPSIWRADALIQFLESMDCLDRLRLIVNRSSRADEIRDTEIQKAINRPVYWKLPNDYGACMDAVNSGKPLTVIDSSELARSYRELAQQITGVAVPEKRRGLLKLFS